MVEISPTYLRQLPGWHMSHISHPSKIEFAILLIVQCHYIWWSRPFQAVNPKVMFSYIIVPLIPELGGPKKSSYWAHIFSGPEVKDADSIFLSESWIPPPLESLPLTIPGWSGKSSKIEQIGSARCLKWWNGTDIGRNAPLCAIVLRCEVVFLSEQTRKLSHFRINSACVCSPDVNKMDDDRTSIGILYENECFSLSHFHVLLCPQGMGAIRIAGGFSHHPYNLSPSGIRISW